MPLPLIHIHSCHVQFTSQLKNPTEQYLNWMKDWEHRNIEVGFLDDVIMLQFCNFVR